MSYHSFGLFSLLSATYWKWTHMHTKWKFTFTISISIHSRFHLPKKQCYEFSTYANQKIYTFMPNTEHLVWSSSVAGEMMVSVCWTIAKYWFPLPTTAITCVAIGEHNLLMILHMCDHNRQRGGAQVHTFALMTHPIYPILCLCTRVWLVALAQGYEIWK